MECSAQQQQRVSRHHHRKCCAAAAVVPTTIITRGAAAARRSISSIINSSSTIRSRSVFARVSKADDDVLPVPPAPLATSDDPSALAADADCA